MMVVPGDIILPGDMMVVPGDIILPGDMMIVPGDIMVVLHRCCSHRVCATLRRGFAAGCEARLCLAVQEKR